MFQIAKEREKEAIKIFEREEQGTKIKEEVRLGSEDYQVFKSQLQARIDQHKKEALDNEDLFERQKKL